jgi:hypothetical protein
MSFRMLGLALAALLGLAACGSEPTAPPTFTDVRFNRDDPVRLDAASIEIISKFEPTFRAPQVEQNFPVPPQRAIENWAHDRLQAVNPTSRAHVKVVILDASAREQPNGEGYTAHVAALVEISDEHGLAVRTARAEATRTKSIEPDATADEKDLLWYAITREVVGALGGELERQIRGTFYPYVL